MRVLTVERPGLNGGTLRSWAPGVSGNPTGRPNFVERVRRATKDGDTIIRTMKRIADGRCIRVREKGPDGKWTTTILRPAVRDIVQVNEWLSDRCWGKPVQAIAAVNAQDAMSYEQWILALAGTASGTIPIGAGEVTERTSPDDASPAGSADDGIGATEPDDTAPGGRECPGDPAGESSEEPEA